MSEPTIEERLADLEGQVRYLQAAVHRCPRCVGQRMIHITRDTGLQYEQCPRCRGRGHIAEDFR